MGKYLIVTLAILLSGCSQCYVDNIEKAARQKACMQDMADENRSRADYMRLARWCEIFAEEFSKTCDEK